MGDAAARATVGTHQYTPERATHLAQSHDRDPDPAGNLRMKKAWGSGSPPGLSLIASWQGRVRVTARPSKLARRCQVVVIRPRPPPHYEDAPQQTLEHEPQPPPGHASIC